jgi:hypothetical protein
MERNENLWKEHRKEGRIFRRIDSAERICEGNKV